MTPHTENEAYAGLLCSHLRGMVHCLRQLPEDRWDWTPDVAAPTARILATHAYQWLVCDRQHIAEPDALKHDSVPEAPSDPQAMCDALAEETDRWEQMILVLTPEQLDEPRRQFNGGAMNVRGFVCHMIQNCIYKNGQFMTLYYALGLDGTAPYTAPFPNPIYAQMHAFTAMQEQRRGEGYEDFARSFAGEDIPPALLEKTYQGLSANAFGLPVRASDSLEGVYHLSESGDTPKSVVRYLARLSGLAVTGALDALPPMETVADLVHAVVAVTRSAPS